jgi:hypothetical protein
MVSFKTIQACFGRIRPQKTAKLHIKLLGQLEGSITFTNFIEPLLPK